MGYGPKFHSSLRFSAAFSASSLLFISDVSETREEDHPFRQLVENLQREDLTPIDEALAYYRNLHKKALFLQE